MTRAAAILVLAVSLALCAFAAAVAYLDEWTR
jgi:hypothetical protein